MSVFFFFCKSTAQPRSQKNNTPEYYTAVHQQRYNGSRAPQSRLCASSRSVCAWLVHSSRRSNRDNINTSNGTGFKRTSDLTPGIRSTQQQRKQYRIPGSSYLCILLVRVRPFTLSTPPGYEGNLIPKRKLAAAYSIYIVYYSAVVPLYSTPGLVYFQVYFL